MKRLSAIVTALSVALLSNAGIGADDKANIRALIPASSAMSKKDFDRLAMLAAPALAQFDDKSLTVVMLMQMGKRSDDKEKQKEFQLLGEGAARPDVLAGEISRPVRIGGLTISKGPITIIHADRITDFTCRIKDNTATGTVSFKLPKICQGKVRYVARRTGDTWRIEEFIMPAHKIHVIRNPKGKWVTKDSEKEKPAVKEK